MNRKVILPLAVLLLLMTGSAAPAQPNSDAKYRGVADCRRCHREPLPEDVAAGVLTRISLTESETWRNHDRHSEAYRVLTDADGRGQRMGRLLGKDVLQAETGCIQCHLTSANPTETVAQTFPITRRALTNEGVGCESCHGPSSRWVEDHRTFATWSAVSTQQKQARGWNDVYDPIVRAELCTSCHIGDAERGRLITHEMYAAGHPLLTGFEIESFADKMPRHWQYGYERDNAAAEPFERTRKLLVGSVVAVRRAIEVAAADAAAPAESHRWPELARLDCFACHHELAVPSWRQERGYAGRAGRPGLALGAVEVAGVAARLAAEAAAAEGEGLESHVRALRRAFEQNPFGDPAKIVESSEALVDWCRATERRLVEMRLDRREANRAIQLFAETAANAPHEYDTARQLVAAIAVINDELESTGVEMDRFADAVDQLRSRNYYLTEPPESRTQKVLVEALIPKQIANRAAYDPGEFAAQMNELNGLRSRD